MYCPFCNSEVNSSVRVIQETYPVKGEDITIDAHVRFCDCCNNDLWDSQLDSQNLLDAFAKYREKHGLMQPADIRSTREKYGLSQAAFARVLGLGDKTITRYENGSVADAAQNNLIELARQPDNFAFLLEKNRDKLSPSDYETGCAAIQRLDLRLTYAAALAVDTYSVDYGIRYSMSADELGGSILCQKTVF